MMKFKTYIILVTIIFGAFSINAQVLTIEITNIRNKCGNIALAIFIDNTSFDKEKPYFEAIYTKAKLTTDTMIVELNLKPGVYGISVLDDENNDGEMKYNWFGIPKEGFGFSNYYHIGIIKPTFKNFDFKLDRENKSVHVKIKYL